METDLSDEQTMLVEATRSFLDAHSPMPRVRELFPRPAGFDPKTWRAAADLGWYGLMTPDTHGGSGVGEQGVIEAAAVAEESGRRLHPGPFLPVTVVAYALTRAGSPEQQQALLPGLVGGDAVGAWALSEGTGCWGTRELAVTATATSEGWVLHGRKRWVQDAGAADLLLVTCRDAAGPLQLLVPTATPGVVCLPLACSDLGRRLHDVRLDGVEVPADAALGSTEAAGGGTAVGRADGRSAMEAQIQRQLQLACVLQSAETVGATQRVLDKAVAYAKDRVAFGRPIGAFQAIKHKLAEAATCLEAAQAATWDAAHAFAEERHDRVRAVHIAKSFVSRHCARIVEECMQVHGGIAMTWDDDCHLYLRRVRTNSVMFGTSRWHEDRLCESIGLVA